jgi:hypothetical protein
MANIVKVTFNIPEDELLVLKALAARRGNTVTSTIRRAVGLEAFVDEEEAKGNRLLILNTDGQTQLVTRK